MKADFAEYRATIELLRECVRGVTLRDGSTMNTFAVRDSAFNALQTTLAALDNYAVTFIQPESMITPETICDEVPETTL